MSPPLPPKLSIVVVFHAMSTQAEDALRSLTAPYQRGVSADDYEVIAVENASTDLLGEERARAAGANVRYFVREEPGVSPIPAARFGFDQARSDYAGLVLDGAHLFTPRVVEHALAAARAADEPVVLVPTYHLGARPHHEQEDAGSENALLDGIRWREDGYRLFEHAVFAPEFERGLLTPRRASACVFFRRGALERAGGLDGRFGLPGGGLAAAHLYGLLARDTATRVFLLWGEGAFHRFHGGTYTSARGDRAALLAAAEGNFRDLMGRPSPVPREPTLLGPVCGAALPFVFESASIAILHHAVRRKHGQPAWPHDP